jgi:hypothetical protein
LEDLPAWQSLHHKFEGEAIGADIQQFNGTSWSAYQTVTEYLSHEAGRSKNKAEGLRKRFESLYWGKNSDLIQTAHRLALQMK